MADEPIPLLHDPEYDGTHTLVSYYVYYSDVCPGEMADWARNNPNEAFSENQDMEIALKALTIFEAYMADD